MKKRDYQKEREMDRREMDRLELEIKKLRDLKSHLEHETKILEVKNSDLREKIKKQDDEIDLWCTYAEGLEARVEIAKQRERKRNLANMGPMLQSVGGAILGTALAHIGMSAMRKDKNAS